MLTFWKKTIKLNMHRFTVKVFCRSFIDIAARPVRYRNHTELQIMYDIKPPSISLRTIPSILSSNGTRIVMRHLHTFKIKRYFSNLGLIFAIFFLTFIFTVCAHKAPPLSKDRLSPKLQEILALNNRQVQFTFSEQLDTLDLKPDYFTITIAEDTLDVILLYPSLSAAEIVALTESQSDRIYEVSGYVFDTAQNKGVFKRSFSGTSRPDTISPWVVDYSKGANHRHFFLKFSEAMDTTFFEFYILPKKLLKPVWKNIRTCFLVPEAMDDSLRYDTTYYLYLDKGARDITNNTISTFVTSITSDTLYEPIILQGTVQIHDTLVKTGVAVIKREYPLGITVIEQGRFAFEVRDSATYTVEVLSGDYSGSAEVSVDSIWTINLRQEGKSIDSLFD